MSFGQDPIFAGSQTLIFSGSTMIQSHFIESMKSSFRRLTPLQRRQNLWAPNVIVDGRYPAQLWTHEFMVYTEVTSNPRQFAHRFFDTEDLIDSDPQLLVLQENLTDRINFGSCYLDSSQMDEPKELLLYRAGFMRIRFLGVTKPTTL